MPPQRLTRKLSTGRYSGNFSDSLKIHAGPRAQWTRLANLYRLSTLSDLDLEPRRCGRTFTAPYLCELST